MAKISGTILNVVEQGEDIQITFSKDGDARQGDCTLRLQRSGMLVGSFNGISEKGQKLVMEIDDNSEHGRVIGAEIGGKQVMKRTT